MNKSHSPSSGSSRRSASSRSRPWRSRRRARRSPSRPRSPPSTRRRKEIFATNCGPCHTLEAAGTDGVVGPNLDELLGTSADIEANTTRVETAILEGLSGRMPAGILQGEDAEEVASFVADNADYVSDPTEPADEVPAHTSASL